MRDTYLESVLKDRIDSYRTDVLHQSPATMREGAMESEWAADGLERYLRTLTAPLHRGTLANTLLTFVILRAMELTERQCIENVGSGEYELNEKAYHIRQSLFMDNLSRLVQRGLLGITADAHIERTLGPSSEVNIAVAVPDVQEAWADIKGVVAQFRYAADTMRMRR
jgi:hypothetical protein